MFKPKSGSVGLRTVISVVMVSLLTSLLIACGDSTALPAPSATPASVAPSPTTSAPATITPSSTTPAPATTIATPNFTTVAATNGAAINSPVTTVARVGTPTPAALNQPLPTPILKADNDVTPIALGASEAALKATGFDGNSAKAFLDGLVTEVGIRVVETPGELKTIEWLEQKFRSFGYKQIERQNFSGQIYPSLVPTIAPVVGRAIPNKLSTPFFVKGTNLIVTRPATNPATAKILILGGHHDTVPNTVGANDNGSGMAVLLEIARVFINRYPDYELRFIGFGGEEEGLLGSSHYLKSLSSRDNSQVVAYLNLDALAVGQWLIVNGSPDLMAQTTGLLSQLGIRLDGLSIKPYLSDHDTFIGFGIKAINLSRWRDFNNHLPTDTADRIFAENLLLSGGVAILIAEYLLKTYG